MVMEKICGNCAHWMRSKDRKELITFRDAAGKSVTGMYFPCAVHAVEADAGDSVALMGERGHCRCHADAFEPADWYLEELREQDTDEASLYGLVPGADFPATLNIGPP